MKINIIDRKGNSSFKILETVFAIFEINPNMNQKKLLDIPIFQLDNYELKSHLGNLEAGSKIGLNFIYSEIFLRASRNKDYHRAISQMMNVCDGKGLNWAIWTTQKLNQTKSNFSNQADNHSNQINLILDNSGQLKTKEVNSTQDILTQNNSKNIVKNSFQNLSQNLNENPEEKGFHSSMENTKIWQRSAYLAQLFGFYCRFSLTLFWKFLTGILILFGFRFGQKVVLGRDFTYELLDLSIQKNWKVVIIGGNETVQKNLVAKLPSLQAKFWFTEADSDLMRDNAVELQNWPKNLGKFTSQEISKNTSKTSSEFQNSTQNKNSTQKLSKNNLPKLTEIHRFLTTQTLIYNFPELANCQNWLQKESPDLILICIGGASGKQEFLFDLLRQNESLNFRLGVCLGAALDHLGSGRQQKESPKIMQKIGLEWLFRFIFQPYRRARIWDSVFGLWWTISLAPFVPSNQEINLKNAIENLK